jgi:tetratricopeptide (TPR) repeat protein
LRSQVFCEIGRLYSGLKAWDKVKESFESALEADSANHGACLALGEALEKLNDPGAALAAYRRALELSPSSPAAQEAIGRLSSVLASEEAKEDPSAAQRYGYAIRAGAAALDLKLYGDASRYFADALAIRSDDAGAWVSFGEARASLGDTNGAIQSLRRALERDPSLDGAKSRLAELEKAKNKKTPPRRIKK